MATENPNPISDLMIVQSGRPLDLVADASTMNKSMASVSVVTPPFGAVGDAKDTDAISAGCNDLLGSQRPSFRDMVIGKTTAEQRDNFISTLDVELLDEDVMVNTTGVFPEIRALKNRVIAMWRPLGEEACGVGNLNPSNGVERRQNKPPVDDRFGPWMQVVNRRRRSYMVRKAVIPDDQAMKRGSRFEVLNVDDGENHQVQVSARPSVINTESPKGNTGSNVSRMHSNMQRDMVDDGENHQVQIPIRPRVTTAEFHAKPSNVNTDSNVNPLLSNLQRGIEDESHGQLSGGISRDSEVNTTVAAGLSLSTRDDSVAIAAKDKVISAPTTLKPDKHKAVKIVEESQSRVLKEQNGRQYYGPIRSAAAKGGRRGSATVKSLPRKEGRFKKKTELDGERTIVTEWASSLSRTLSKEGELALKPNMVSVEVAVDSSNDGVQWIEN
ncbi:hypothetical protein V6N12_059213 [Hibiscus sabdariffa]|uniref:Uncharacterized protein n=1 Tax=Hibiscus sabdariffa TaxID=183260 RepID=A0ABR2EUE7_9ROSI